MLASHSAGKWSCNEWLILVVMDAGAVRRSGLVV